MNLGKKVDVNGKNVKLDFRLDCSTDSVIYLATCKICEEEEIPGNFYFGQTINSLMSRCNGHRDKFKLETYDKSALSMHIMDKHVDGFGKKLNNFNFGLVSHCSPEHLNRREDFYI